MSKEIAAIERKPWEEGDPERVREFHKGEVGKTSDRWDGIPEIGDCWKGPARREWYVDEYSRADAGQFTVRTARGETNTSYQNQLYCRAWKKFVNPSGYTCHLCKRKLWPEVVRVREQLKAGKAGAAHVLAMARLGRLTATEALELAEEFSL